MEQVAQPIIELGQLYRVIEDSRLPGWERLVERFQAYQQMKVVTPTYQVNELQAILLTSEPEDSHLLSTILFLHFHTQWVNRFPPALVHEMMYKDDCGPRSKEMVRGIEQMYLAMGARFHQVDADPRWSLFRVSNRLQAGTFSLFVLGHCTTLHEGRIVDEEDVMEKYADSPVRLIAKIPSRESTVATLPLARAAAGSTGLGE